MFSEYSKEYKITALGNPKIQKLVQKTIFPIALPLVALFSHLVNMISGTCPSIARNAYMELVLKGIDTSTSWNNAEKRKTTNMDIDLLLVLLSVGIYK